jgi:hypothetical protein
MPTSKLGKVAVWLCSMFILAFVISQIFYMISMATSKNFIFSDNVLPYVIIAGFIAEIVAMILALICILKYKEHSGILYVIAIIGLVPIIFVLGELILPH